MKTSKFQTGSGPHIVVIGAGIGGLTAAALLAQAGYDVTVLEAEVYPGGCAGTYYHKGYRFDAGATLAGGFQPGGPHAILGERLGITWPVRPANPAWVVHLPDRSVVLDRDNTDVLDHFPASEPFWAEQRRAANHAWTLAGRGLPWPPTNLTELVRLARTGLASLPGGLSLLPLVFQTTADWLRHHGLGNDAVFHRFIDAQLLISAQTVAARANALYSATALDLPRQGVRDVEGGMGGLALRLVETIQAAGGRVLYKHAVTRIDVTNRRVTGVQTRRGNRPGEPFAADFVLANLTPWSLDALLAEASPPTLRREISRRAPGWGAFVLYLGVDAAQLPPGLPDHHQVITSLDGPLGEGRSIFISLSPAWDASRAPAGHRAVTVTTHTDIRHWWELVEHDPPAYAARKEDYTGRILEAIERAIPGFRRGITLLMPGTPVTYQAFTRRHGGMVGGFPQASLWQARGPRTGLPNLRLVGDSIFPGQSTAGVTVGAMRVAADVQRHLPYRVARRMSFSKTRTLLKP